MDGMIRVQGFRLDWLLDVQPLLESNGGVEVKPRGQAFNRNSLLYSFETSVV